MTALLAARTPVLAAVLLAACGGDERPPPAPQAAEGPAPAAPPRASPASAPAYQTVASGLEVPWDLGFAPDGRIFVTEREGRIRVVENGRLRPEPWAELDVEAVGEAGLTSIAVAPDFARSGAVYVLGTFRGEGGLENRVVRLVDRGGRGADPRVVVGGLPAERVHAGSALDFGPDGMLYVTTGDARQPPRAQDPRSLAGKLLRYRPDGSVPPDNPFGGSPVYALGLRNSQGIDWNEEGELFAAEHGPSGFANEGDREGHDELNHLRPGGNYGWPEVAGLAGGGRFAAPLAAWTPAVAPAGLAVYRGDAFPAWRGDAFLGALRGEQLIRVGLERSGGGWRASGQEALFLGELGRIRAVRMGPDGALYFTTSNRDGRGDPREGDDRVLRVVPRG
ncbi:MAG TPA: PQQ-dependent sugar dehydrogenase [Longimicrobiaceae bacterium]|nr:PQQ-dependent sugar dehydrogenase [Longimicrobiaceae bacterium]